MFYILQRLSKNESETIFWMHKSLSLSLSHMDRMHIPNMCLDEFSLEVRASNNSSYIYFCLPTYKFLYERIFPKRNCNACVYLFFWENSHNFCTLLQTSNIRWAEKSIRFPNGCRFLKRKLIFSMKIRVLPAPKWISGIALTI